MTTKSRLLIVAGVVVLGSVIFLWVTISGTSQRTPKPTTPTNVNVPVAATSRDRQLANSPEPRSAVPLQARALGAPPAGSSPQTAAEFERAHRGFNKSFRSAVDENLDFRRAERRCLLKLPVEVKVVEFSTVQTYTKSSDTMAKLSDVSVSSDAPGVEEFEQCEKTALQTYAVTLPLTDATMPDEFQVKDGGRLGFDRNPAPDVVDKKLTSLKNEIDRSPADSRHTALLQQQYDMYACYKTKHSMEDCL